MLLSQCNNVYGIECNRKNIKSTQNKIKNKALLHCLQFSSRKSFLFMFLWIFHCSVSHSVCVLGLVYLEGWLNLLLTVTSAFWNDPLIIPWINWLHKLFTLSPISYKKNPHSSNIHIPFVPNLSWNIWGDDEVRKMSWLTGWLFTSLFVFILFISYFSWLSLRCFGK